MDPRLLEYFNRELVYLRELGAEFAAQFPKVAARLGMRGIEVADPYVERLLEGFAFLSARIQLKMDAEFPRFSQRLLEVVYPGYLAPTPSMAVVRFEAARHEGGGPEGFELPRGTRLRARLPANEQTACEFRTGDSVVLWPLRLVEARLTAAPPDLPLTGYRWGSAVRGALRLRFETTHQVSVNALSLDRLPLFIAGPVDVASRIQEFVHTQVIGVLVHAGGLPIRELTPLPATAVQPEGFAPEQALLPCDNRAFDGYRLLHEYFAFPDRFRFFSLTGLNRALRRIPGSQFEVVVLFKSARPDLESLVDASSFELFCVPVVNLFERSSDRIPVTASHFEYHAVIDRAKPLDYEIHTVRRVRGHRIDDEHETIFLPFYSSAAADRGEGGAYFSVRREPRLLSERSRRHGPRTGYIGSECFISLVDSREAPYSEQLRQITVEALCTNRDLPLLTPVGHATTDLTMTVSAPVEAIRFVVSPSRPTPALAEREITWRLISHLSLNFLTLTDLNPTEGAAALRELLRLYAPLGQPAHASTVAALQHARMSAVSRRLPQPGPIVYGRGVAIDLTVDELPFAGTSPWLFGAVLDEFLARHVSINAFTELSLHSLQRGLIARWPPRVGRRPIA
ncbi:MAG: type VI secretion system baseplate subunit TssF [Casimicrobiaceae bacterium]|nr:type VI secretion system baseplate subunit TssF [Casimicrobiaceae bacterium]